MNLPRQTYANLAAIVFGAASLGGLARLWFHRPALTVWANTALSVTQFVFFGVTALVLLFRHRSASLVSASWTLGFVGILMLVCEGIGVLIPLGDKLPAALYVAAAALSAFLFKRAFDRGLLRHAHDIDPRLA